MLKTTGCWRALRAKTTFLCQPAGPTLSPSLPAPPPSPPSPSSTSLLSPLSHCCPALSSHPLSSLSTLSWGSLLPQGLCIGSSLELACFFPDVIFSLVILFSPQKAPFMEALPTYYFPWDPLTPSLSGSINLWLYVSLQVHRLSWFCTCQLLEHHAGWGRANCLFTSRSSVSRPCLAVSGCCLVPEE